MSKNYTFHGIKFNYLNDLISLREKQRKQEGFKEAIAKLLI